MAAACIVSLTNAQNSNFHNSPPSAKEVENPVANDPKAAAAGQPLYHLRCARCHGERGEGSGNIPSIANGKVQSVSDGQLFWFITKGDVPNGMPAWASLPRDQRWHIISYVKAMGSAKLTASGSVSSAKEAANETVPNLPAPRAPFTDFRFEKPGDIRKITVNDLPAPFLTPSAGNRPTLVARPDGAWPQVPEGFEVGLYATGLDEPRLIRTAPNGDLFVAESKVGDIRVFRGITKSGKPEQMQLFASGLSRPFGINFYPPGPNPE
jgi:mono/diheme cytochrome c family protein